MAGTKTEIIKSFKKMPFEIYYNNSTEHYHLIEHLGYMRSKPVWRVKKIGEYATFMKAKEILEQIIEEEGYTWMTVTAKDEEEDEE